MKRIAILCCIGQMRVLVMKKIVISILIVILGFFCIDIKAENYFKEGVEWIVEIVPTYPLSSYEKSYKLIKSSEDIEADALALLDCRSGNTEALIKTENEKVYFRWIDAIDDQWYLLYDFSMLVGDEYDVYNAWYQVDPTDLPRSSQVKCLEINEADSKYDNWKTFSLREYTKRDEWVGERDLIWISGIGSVKGPLDNTTLNLDGDGTSLLRMVKLDDKVIFKMPTNGVNSLNKEQEFNFSVKGGQLVFTGVSIPKDIVIQTVNGQLVTCKKVFDKNYISIILPYKGIYVVQTEDSIHKIIY